MSQGTFFSHPHRRRNALTGDWMLVSPHRAQRPWQGQREAAAHASRPAHDPECYLCAGNTRIKGEINPDYLSTYVFPNDFPALLPEKVEQEDSMDGLFQAKAVQGVSRVICFSPRHDLTLAQMTVPDITSVVDTWSSQAAELGATWRWVQIFENKGAAMGCSNPHPHGQIWASDNLPNEIIKEDGQQQRYFSEKQRPLLLDYAEQELALGQRMVESNDHWVAVVPYWAVWPYEILLMPRQHIARLPDLDSGQRQALASILQRILIRYDNLFETSFPYSMGWHGAPFGEGSETDAWQLHAHFYPPLLRSATVKKFMVGYEMLGEPQRDLTPEEAAARLRDLSTTHYLNRE